MKPIDAILKRITVLYYIFLLLIVASSAVSFVAGLTLAAQKQNMLEMAHFSAVESVLFMATQFLITFGAIWMLVLFVRMLIIIGKSLKDKDLFNLKIVSIIHKYIILSIVVGGLSYFNLYWLGGFISPFNSTAQLVTDILSSVSTIVMLLMFCEVLKIGHILKEEQDLTI